MERIGLPMLLAVDEEGGSVCRISGRGILQDDWIPSMKEVGLSGDTDLAHDLGIKIGGYLSDLGFNTDFAPVADVLTNPENGVVKERSFGSNPQLTAEMAVSIIEGLHSNGILAVMKHFPGHGSTVEDSHDDYACSYMTEEELEQCDFIPFKSGIEVGVDMIMVGHISLPNVTGDLIPSTLNSKVVTSILREKMNYDGVIITDALNMGAITNHYDSAEAVVLAVQAGCDLLLMPADWHAAYYGLLEAIEEDVISEERIDESVRRILRMRMSLDESAGEDEDSVISAIGFVKNPYSDSVKTN